MKKRLLASLLAMFSCFSLFAQTISGEQNPCPGTPTVYQITLPVSAGIPSQAQLDNGFQSAPMTSTQSGTSVTYKYTITWNNFYQVVGGSPVKSSFILRHAFILDSTYTTKVTIKGLSDVQFSSVPAPACNFRGNTTVSVNAVTNATKYVWTNSAGWGNNNAETSTPSIQFNVNNGNAATVTVTAINGNCSNVSKSNSTTVNRAPVTVTPVITANNSGVVCPGTSVTATVSGAEGTPVRYEWYTGPTGYVKINGIAATSTAPANTTGTSVTLTYANTTGGDAKPVVLLVRAVYDENGTCKSPEGRLQLATGIPVSDMFQVDGNGQGTVITNSAPVCQFAVLYLFPQNNYPADKITAHEWEYVEGDYSSINGFSGPSMRVRMANDPLSFLRLRYRFNTPCGWSEWNNLYLYNDPGCGDWLVAAKKEPAVSNKTTMPEGFSVSPNPASGVISVTMPVVQKGQSAFRLNITNMKGDVLVSRRQAPATKFTVDVSSLPSGNYVVQIDAGTHKYSKQIVIVK